MSRLPPEPPEAPAGLASMALETLSDMVVITDTSGRIVYVNPAFTEVTGYTAAEAVGGTPQLLNSGLQDQDFYQELWDTVLRGEIWRGELVNKRRDGSLYTDEMVITPLRNGAGEISHFLAVKRSIAQTLGAVADSSPTGIAHLGRDGSLVYANATLERLFDATYDQLVGDRWLTQLDDEDTAEVAGHLSLEPDPDRPGPTIRLPSGRYGTLRTAPLTGRDETELGVVVTVEDVTNAVAANELAATRERFAYAIVDALHDPTLVVDNEARPLHANTAYEVLMDVVGDDTEPGGLVTGWPDEFGARQLDGLVRRALDPAVTHEPEEIELAAMTAQGMRWWLVRAAELSAAQGAVITWTDITRRKHEELRLAHRAAHDDLTGLVRRDAAMAWLTETLPEVPVGLIYLDLDGFKAVNDELGHAAGDELLLTVGRRLSRTVRSSDLAARLGGDEFLLLVRDVDNTLQLERLIDRVRTSVERPVRLSVGIAKVGLSAGTAIAIPGDDAAAVLAAADRRMYNDKHTRRASD